MPCMSGEIVKYKPNNRHITDVFVLRHDAIVDRLKNTKIVIIK